MKKLIAIVPAAILLAGCATDSGIDDLANDDDMNAKHAADNARYECSAYQSGTHVLTLPVPPDGETLVSVKLHGDSIEAIYSEVGLMKKWNFTDNIFIRVKPDMSAQYYDFTSADDGEQRTPEAMFQCKKRK